LDEIPRKWNQWNGRLWNPADGSVGAMLLKTPSAGNSSLDLLADDEIKRAVADKLISWA
jgi:hypothetical protein